MKRRIFAITLAALLAAGSASAATVVVGPDLGFDVYSAEGFQSSTSFSIPSSSDPFLGGFRPGMRLGVWDATRRNEVFLDTGLNVLSSGGDAFSTFVGTLNYAYAFNAGTSPYLTLGGGVASISYGGISESYSIFGGGVGGRHRLAHGHGGVRLEVRYDRVSSGKSNYSVNIVGMKLGFDLDLN